jgi:Glycine rich protein/Secretion system C-terminal sorting domain/Bacterial Ig-like domain (group 2)
MKSFYISRLFILAAILLGWTGSSLAQTTTFSYTGGMQTYQVPSGVNYIAIDAQGAQGGLCYYTTYGKAGCGGRVQAVMAVTAGQVLNIFVGGAGPNGTTSGNATGGYNGGGTNGSYGYGAPGGGASDIRFGGTATSNRILVAGGGGGAGYNCGSGMDGGGGGGVVGETGWCCGSQAYSGMCYNPTGGTQTAGGLNGTCVGGSASGGTGGTAMYYGGGGGGGYYGGGGGYYAGGAGGSSYPAGFGGNFITLTHTQKYNCSGNGVIKITPDPGPAPGYTAFSYTGGIQTYTVPTGVNFLSIDMAGAAGGTSYSTYGAGGCGGRLRATLAVTAGQVYYIFNGGMGQNGTSSGAVLGGFNGGGNTNSGYPYSAGGGGATDIRFGGTALSNRIMVAGGGGGGGYNCGTGNQGGGGGGLTGETGWTCSSQAYSGFCYNPTGGTQTTAGANGTCWGGTASANVGGNGIYYGGAGGGGYYGGGGGYYAGGAGGSSWVNPGGTVTGALHNQGYNCSMNGYTIINPTATASSLTVFSYTGAVQTYTVPTGITIMAVDVSAASGGLGLYGAGGCGGNVVCTLAVTPGQVFYVYTGGRGQDYNTSSVAKLGGFNGGANTGAYPYMGGGGGASDLRTGGTALSNRWVVAGGGGGGSYNCSSGMQGGKGGGLTGENGFTCGGNSTVGCQIPGGGTQTAGGLNATCYGGSGSLGVGGTGQYYGGAGGGGYYGGGGGYYCGGAGGSSYTDPTAASAVVHTQGGTCGSNGIVYLTPICTAGPISGVLATCTTGSTQLTDPTTGGSWYSGNTAIATVNAATGLVSGVSAGTATISYGGTFACGTVYTTAVVNVALPPATISGATYLCQSVATTLSDAVSGGTWSSSNTSFATITSIGGVATGVAPGTVTITYTIGSCFANTTFTVNPTAPITGPASVCSTYLITLSDGITGGTWTSSNSSMASVDAVTGDVTGGSVSGVPIISYTLSTGCSRTYNVTNNPLPAAYTGNMFVCKGLTTVLTETTTPGTWSSQNTSIATVVALTTTTGSVFGAGAGTVNISYTLPTGCYLSVPFTVNPLPTAIIAPVAGSCITNSDNPAITLSDASTGGTWTSSNSAVAAITSGGLLTSYIVGSTSITYTLPTGCIATLGLTVNGLPAAVTGTKVVCQNAVTYLNDASIGGTWSSSNTGLATVGLGTGIVTGVAQGNPVISYTMSTGCLGLATVTVNPAPANITGNVPVCVGSQITLASATLGANSWASSNSGMATITTPTPGGVVTGVNPGNPVITYTIGTTGCMGFTTLTVNAVPAAITPSTAAVCFGNTVTLNTTATGGVWSSSAPATASVAGGVVTPLLSAPTQQTVNINYSYPSTGCKATRTVSINPAPVAYNLTASKSSYCAGDMNGIDLTLANSANGVKYYLYNGTTPDGRSVNGNGSSKLFKSITAAGTYNVIGVDMASGCSNAMTGNPTISIDPIPTAHILSIQPGFTAKYCAGGTGSPVQLDWSESTNQYYLKNIVSGSIQQLSGVDGILSFGNQLGDSTYVAYALTNGAGCKNNMMGAVTITKNNLPVIKDVTVSDSGYYCVGGAGVHIGLTAGSTGVNYSLYKGSTFLKKVAGSNSDLDFGGGFKLGSYTVIAENAATGCQETMNGTIIVAERSLPLIGYTVTPATEGYCAGGEGVSIKMTSSEAPNISYQLMLGTTPVGYPLNGSTPGAALDFGPQFAGGTYSIVATDNTFATHCSATLTGKSVITAYPALKIDTVTLGNNGQFCAGTPGVAVILNGSDATLQYEVYKVGGGTPILSHAGTGGPINFGLDATAGPVTVIGIASLAGNCKAFMYGTPTVIKNELPAAADVTVDNKGYYCAGGTGVHIGLSFSDVGVKYQLYKGGVATGAPLTGSSSSLDFGTFTNAGTYTVVGTNTATTCYNDMNGSAVVSVNATPTAHNVTGGGSYCDGTIRGVKVGLFSSDIGINYQLYNGTTQIGSLQAGSGSGLDFGFHTLTGLYTIVGTNNVTGCASNMNGSRVITIDPLPTAFTVTGGGSYCVGAAGHNIGLSNSVTGVNYQLYNATTPVGAAKPGITGNAIDFGVNTATGTYTVVGTTAISGCTSNMIGSAVIDINTLPAQDTVKGGGGYCAGGAGADVYMSGSQPGVTYQLFNGATPSGTAPVLGTGSSIDLGLQSAGTYTAVATNAATGCTNNMIGSVTVVATPLPNAYTVSGGGTMCSNGTGINIYLGGSQSGISYALYNGGSTPLATISGTGSALSFGPQSANGIYTVLANDPLGCSRNMNGSGNIVVNPAPGTFAISGGGNYCYGGKGVAVGLSGSESGVNYQLYNSATAVGLPVGGTGAAITFGLQKNAGTSYVVKATNTATACAADMTGTTTVGIDIPGTPAVTIDAPLTSCIGKVINYTAMPVLGGSAPAYTWKVNGGIVGVGSTYANIPATGDVVSVDMISNANCVTTTKASNAITMNSTPYVTPAAVVTSSPGTDICHSTPVTFTAATSFEGTAPGLSWMKNGKFVGTGRSYTYTPNSGKDVITFMLISDYVCKTNDTVFSDPVVMTVDTALTPVFTITSSWGPMTDAVGVGQIDTFTAHVTSDPRYNYTYQWYIQGTPVPGANQPVYIDHATYNNDVVSCQVTKTGACGDQSATLKTTIIMKNVAVQSVTTISEVTVVPNPNKGEFTVKGTLGSKNDEEVTLQVTNMLGQTVYTGKVMTRGGNINEHVKLSNTLANGMYLLNLRSGNALSVFHMVIEQ